MLSQSHRSRLGFTLVEIMVVIAIIAMLAAIAVSNFSRGRRRAQATMILEDLRIIDSAIDQYAIENSKEAGAVVQWPDIQKYLKTNTPLYNSSGLDTLGNVIGGFSVDTFPKLSSASYTQLSDIVPSSFWSPYYP